MGHYYTVMLLFYNYIWWELYDYNIYIWFMIIIYDHYIYIIAEVFPAAITNHPSGGGPQLHRPSLGGVSGDQHGHCQYAKTTGAGEISRDSARFCVKVVCFCCHIEDFGSSWLVQWSPYQYFPRWLVVTWHLKRWFEALVIQRLSCAINFGINTVCHVFLNKIIWICLFENCWCLSKLDQGIQLPNPAYSLWKPRSPFSSTIRNDWHPDLGLGAINQWNQL